MTVLLVFVYPTYQAAERQDTLTQIVIHKAVTEFVDAARTKGYISPKMYSDFTDQLGSTNNAYTVEIEHLHKKYNPIYSDPADPTTFQQSFQDYYDGHYTEEIEKVMFPSTVISADSDSRKYKMSAGDFITVEVKSKNPTLARTIRSYLIGEAADNSSDIYMTYSGMILNEDY